jgi:hypothetical protein
MTAKIRIYLGLGGDKEDARVHGILLEDVSVLSLLPSERSPVLAGRRDVLAWILHL